MFQSFLHSQQEFNLFDDQPAWPLFASSLRLLTGTENHSSCFGSPADVCLSSGCYEGVRNAGRCHGGIFPVNMSLMS